MYGCFVFGLLLIQVTQVSPAFKPPSPEAIEASRWAEVLGDGGVLQSFKDVALEEQEFQEVLVNTVHNVADSAWRKEQKKVGINGTKLVPYGQWMEVLESGGGALNALKNKTLLSEQEFFETLANVIQTLAEGDFDKKKRVEGKKKLEQKHKKIREKVKQRILNGKKPGILFWMPQFVWKLVRNLRAQIVVLNLQSKQVKQELAQDGRYA